MNRTSANGTVVKSMSLRRSAFSRTELLYSHVIKLFFTQLFVSSLFFTVLLTSNYERYMNMESVIPIYIIFIVVVYSNSFGGNDNFIIFHIYDGWQLNFQNGHVRFCTPEQNWLHTPSKHFPYKAKHFVRWWCPFCKHSWNSFSGITF